MHPCKYALSGFCCFGCLHTTVVKLFECSMDVHPDTQPPCCFFVELDKTVSHFDFGCEFRPGVLLVASAVREECCFCLHSVELEISPGGQFDVLSSAGFKFLNHLVHFLPGYNLSKVIHKAEAFDCFDSLFHPLHQPSSVCCEDNRRYR
jgi:hypothetical protein